MKKPAKELFLSKMDICCVEMHVVIARVYYLVFFFTHVGFKFFFIFFLLLQNVKSVVHHLEIKTNRLWDGNKFLNDYTVVRISFSFYYNKKLCNLISNFVAILFLMLKSFAGNVL